jgi:hypothetical protein
MPAEDPEGEDRIRAIAGMDVNTGLYPGKTIKTPFD